ncbi:fumarylacetoacetate hydrolase family protein [Marisediminicola sp. LYQ134]|uniref:fumarylacetoacetate hydrolase family protein n=1 Tax=unclassified Marisediminicola TaxID=2618316 RepID=UPI00398398B7
MRLVTYRSDDGPRPGAVVDGERVVDLSGIAESLEALLADTAALAEARELATAGQQTRSLAEVGLLAPVQPGRILCLGYNYRGHVRAGASERDPDPEYPDVFVKTPNVLRGPADVVTLPRVSDDVDYEGEIALVIGRRADAVSLDDAASHIAGYTLFNDVSARDWQGRSSQWELGKCFDGFGPLGPWITTSDAVADPHDLTVEVVRDGLVTVSQSTADLVFPMAFIVHYLSQVMVLEPGDVIATGSPQKLPDALAAHRPLADGDSVTIRVAGLGELTTRFAAAAPRTEGVRS